MGRYNFLCASLRPLRLCVCSLFLVSLLHSSSAATNDLSGLLQKGLFEEEANRNLDAASAAYQKLVTQLDKDRQIGATAIFRLGEIYRKQNKTNEAVAQYERIVREFADQETLVTLSRQNVAGLRVKQTSSNATESNLTRSSTGDADIQKLKSLSSVELRQVLPTLVPDQLLNKLLEQLNSTQTKRMEQVHDFGPSHPQIKSLDAVLEVVNKQIDDRIAGILKALELRASASAGSKPAIAVAPAVDANGNFTNEDDEIRRLQALIQNSPDLINGTPGQNPLITAVSAGWLRVVNFLLDNGANVNAVSGGKTALHQAVGNGNKAMIEVLLKRGAEINTKDGTGGTALHTAAENGFLSIAEVLVKYKADLNARNSKQNNEVSPLHLAAKNGHSALVGFLLASGDDVNRKDGGGGTPLHIVAGQGRDGVIERLLKSGADVNATNVNGWTPLMAATDSVHSISVKALLAGKADPNVVNKNGRTALSLAVERGHSEVVKLLLDAKADVNAGTAESPLLLAVRADNLTLAETLLRLDADTNQETECELLIKKGPKPDMYRSTGNRGKRTPLQVAVIEEHPAMVTLLMRFKGDPHAKTYDGSSLFLATLGNPTALKAFLEAGADANGKDGKGQCALITAASSGDSAAVNLLLSHGARTEVHGNDDETPLLSAIGSGSTNCVTSLLAAGADVNVKNVNGWSALHYATGLGSKAILQMLLAKSANPNVRNSEGKTPLDLTKPQPNGGVALHPSPGGEIYAKPSEMADLLRAHGALDDLPDFKSIRITRQGITKPLVIFGQVKLTNHFTLLETVMNFYRRDRVLSESQNGVVPAHQALPFPDFGRIIIRRPSTKPGGKNQEIKVSLLNGKSDVDCALDVPVLFGDVIEIPERVHALNESQPNVVGEIEKVFREANRGTLPKRSGRIERDGETNSVPIPIRAEEAARNAALKADAQRLACLQKTVQLIVASERNTLVVDSWKEGFLTLALGKTEARAVLRSSSDLSRVKVTRKDTKSGKPVVLTVDATDTNDWLWLHDGDVIEVPDKP